MAARAAGGVDSSESTRIAPAPGRSGGTLAAQRVAAAKSRTPRIWARRINLAGRIGVWAIPVLAVLAALSLTSTNAFSGSRATYAEFLATKWSSPMAIALTLATVVFALISLIGLTLLLYAGRARRLAIAGAVLGVTGAVMMLLSVGSVVVQKQGAATSIFHGRFQDFAVTPNTVGTGAAWTVFGGASLLTLGWILVGFAVMRTHGLSRGDGGLLAISAPLVYLGGFVLHILPALGAFLLGAAGLGIIFASGRVTLEAAPAVEAVRVPRTPAPVPSAFARFTDDDEVLVPQAGDAPPIVDGVRSHIGVPSHGVHTGAAHQHEAAPAANGHDAHPAPVRSRGLGRLSRGISTAWQVNRSKSTTAANGASVSGTAGAGKGGNGKGVNGSRDPMGGLVNGEAKAPVNGATTGSRSRWSSMLNGSSRSFSKAADRAAATGAGHNGAGHNGAAKAKGAGKSGGAAKSNGGAKSNGAASSGAGASGTGKSAPAGNAGKAANQKSAAKSSGPNASGPKAAGGADDGGRDKTNRRRGEKTGGAAASEGGRGTARE